MNLDELRSVQSKERQKDSLQNLRPSFYREVGEYIAELKEERDRAAEAASDPFSSPEVGRLTDEIETAKGVVEAIYERRMGKLVKQASLAAAGMPANDEGLTEEEQELFADLVARIRTNKGRVLDVLEWNEEAADGTEGEPELSPEGPATADESPVNTGEARARESTAPPEGEGVSVADAMGGELPADDTPTDAGSREGAGPEPADQGTGPGSDPGPETGPGGGREGGEPDQGIGSGATPADSTGSGAFDAGSTSPEPGDGIDAPSEKRERSADGSGTTPPAGSGGVERVTVRITRDVGSILGVDDREYTLANDDVVTLPEQNATPLLERDAAEPIE